MTSSSTTVAEPGTRTHWGRWIALVGLLMAEAMNLLDSTITTIAAPVIRTDLGGAVSDTQWVVAAYTLPFAVGLVLGGRLGDITGRRRMFVLGVVGFLLMSAACAAAPNMLILLIARTIQGAFAALIIPQTIGLIKASFTGAALPKALSLMGPVMGLTAVTGPLLGGLITHADIAGLSWRAVFLVNFPLGLLVLATTVPFLIEDRAIRKPGLDIPGFLIGSIAAAAFVVPTISGQAQSWPAWTWICMSAGAASTIVLVIYVRRRGTTGRAAIIEPSLFRDRGFPAALASSVLYFAVSIGIVFAAVLYLQDGLDRGVLTSSLTVLPFSAGLAVASLLAGQLLLPKVGNTLMVRGVAVLLLGLAAGVAAAATAPDSAISPWIPVALGVAGLGGGLITVPFFTAALSRVQPHETGSAAGLLNAVQQLGGTLGIAVLGATYLDNADHPGHAFAATFGLSLAFTLLLAVTASVMLHASTTEASA